LPKVKNQEGFPSGRQHRSNAFDNTEGQGLSPDSQPGYSLKIRKVFLREDDITQTPSILLKDRGLSSDFG
jgi:hypothetical protein